MNHPTQAGRSVIAIPIFLLLVIAGGYLSRGYFATPEMPVHATVLPAPAPLPEFELMNHNGDLFGTDAFKGRWSLVFFGFTNCPDICPVALQQMVVARRRMAEANPELKLPDIVFVSVDPGRDSADVLAQYVGGFGSTVTGVRGDPDELRKLTGAIGIFFAVSPGVDEYSVAHSAAVIVINENAEFHALFSAPYDIDTFVNEMPLIIAAK